MTKWILIALVAFVAFFHWNSGRTARAFEKATAELQRRAPFDVAPDVRLEKAELKGKELALSLRLLDEEADAPQAQQSQGIHLLKTMLTKGWCANKDLRPAINDGYVISVTARRADGSVLTRVNVTEEECICAVQGDICVIR